MEVRNSTDHCLPRIEWMRSWILLMFDTEYSFMLAPEIMLTGFLFSPSLMELILVELSFVELAVLQTGLLLNSS